VSEDETPEQRLARWTNTDAAIGRFGEPNEIVTTALYLASPHSSFTTGAIISVDG